MVKKKEKKKVAGKKMSKKALAVLLSCIAAVLVLTTVGLCLWFFVFKKEETCLKSYESYESFSRAERVLQLSENVSVCEYDVVNEVFITQEKYMDGMTQNAVTLYGLAGWDKEYTARPCFVGVISVRGDYAIVTRSSENYASSDYYIGLIKFRGSGTEEGVLNLSDFSLKYSASNTEQFYFCGDYLCVMGDLESPSSEAAYTTFYEYKGLPQPLERFRIRYGYDSSTGVNYTVAQYDNYVVAYNSNGAYFFDITRDLAYNGYLELSKTGSYPSPYTSTEYTLRMAVQYMGNGWFLRYAAQTAYTPFQGYSICYQAMDATGNTTLVFARTSTDFFNVKTGITKRISQISTILEVANKYTFEAFAATSNSYNNNSSMEDDYPCLNPADMVKDGYSLLYYYIRPYIGLEDVSSLLGELNETLTSTYDRQTLEDILRAQGEATYCLLDANMDLVETDTMFPVATVDGCGFETADPYFDIKFGDAVLYTDKGKKTLLRADPEKQYAVVGVKGKNVTVAAIDLSVARSESTEETGMTYGAVTTDGKIIVDCIYDRLSAFYGGYAIGTKKIGDQLTYYRVDEKGNETVIEDMYLVKDGTYIYADGEKVGLKNFAGDVLLNAEFDNVSLSENYMVNGVYQKSFVIATEGKTCYLYKLE